MLHSEAHLRFNSLEYLKLLTNLKKKINFKMKLMVHLSVKLRVYLRVH